MGKLSRYSILPNTDGSSWVIAAFSNHSGFGSVLEARHIAVMKEYVARDKNRPSVIMWSVGNEPKSSQLPAKDYFK